MSQSCGRMTPPSQALNWTRITRRISCNTLSDKWLRGTVLHPRAPAVQKRVQVLGRTQSLNSNFLPIMDKLWRILYMPRNVYDELSTNSQIATPLIAVLGAVAIAGLVQLNARSLLTAPLGWLIGIALIATGFFVVGKICKTNHNWSQWFGFTSWTHVPLILPIALDVLLTLLNVDMPRITVYSFLLGEKAHSIELGIPWWLWPYIVSILGLRSWTSKGTGASIGLALVPYALLVLPLILLFVVINAFFLGAASQM